MRLEQIERIREWFTSYGGGCNVRLTECKEPPRDPDDDYEVVYEASFEPNALTIARFEFWITDDGNVAVGFETKERVAKRLAVACRSAGFVGGHEPVPLTAEALTALLTQVAGGHIAVVPHAVPFVGLTTAKAACFQETIKALRLAGYSNTDWLQEYKQLPRDALIYERW